MGLDWIWYIKYSINYVFNAKIVKKLLICSLFTFFCTFTVLNAQRNAVYLSFQPQDLGAGIRYDRLFNENGLYASASYGNYKFDEGYIRDHVRLTIGALTQKDDVYLSFGVAYNFFGEQKGTEGMNPRALQDFTFELGAGCRLELISIAFRFDPVQICSSIDIGLNF